uniref:phage tail tape measure protein n=1 Tax=Aquisalimonas sp. TaxID=1872621 RepID=UPI0025BFDF74
FAFLETASKFAIGGVTDVETAVDGLTTAMNAWGDEAGTAEDVAAGFFTAVQDGKTTAEELSASLFQVAPAASAAGVSLEETLAAVSTLTASGTPTSVATTQIRQAINELNDPAREAAQVFERLSGQSFGEFTAAGGTVQEALALLSDEADSTGANIAEYFGSVEAGAAATTLAGEGADAFADSIENQAAAAEDSAAVVENAYNIMDESAQRSWERARNAGTNALIVVGETVAPIAAEVADRLVPAIESAAERFSTMLAWIQSDGPAAVSTITTIATVVGAVLLPVIIRAGVSMVTSWTMGTVAALRAAVTHVAASYRIVGGFAMQSAAAIRHGAFAIRYYVTLGAQAAAAAGRQAAATAAIVAGWIRQGAAATAQAARMAVAWLIGVVTPAVGAVAAMVVTAAAVVAGWVLMGVQAMAQAVRMAAAWLIALGPIGWVIAAVIAVAALVYRYWDQIVAFTSSLVERVTGWMSALRERVSAAWASLVERVTGFVTGLRDRVVATIASLAARAIRLVVTLVTSYVRMWTQLGTRVFALVRNLATRVVGAVTGLRDRAVAIVVALVASWIARFTQARERAAAAMQLARTLVTAAVTGLRDAVTDRIRAVVTTVTGLPGRIRSALGNTGRMLLDAGRNIINGLIEGIRSRFAAIGRAMSDAVGRVRDYLPWSPARRGPLRRNPPEQGGRNIGTAMAAGIVAARRDVEAATATLTGAAVADVDAAALDGVGRTTGRRATARTTQQGASRPVTIEAVNLHRADPFEVADELAWRVRTSHA